MAVGADSQQEHVQLRVVELPLVVRGRLLLAELASDAVHGARRHLEVVEQRLLRHAVVRVLVVRRDAALVAPPELDLAPVRCVLRRLLVRLLRRSPAGEDDVPAFLRRARESLRRHRGHLVRILDDHELDVASDHGSPAASSFDRIIAA